MHAGYPYAECHNSQFHCVEGNYIECLVLSVAVLTVVVPIAVKLNAILLSVVAPKSSASFMTEASWSSQRPS